MSIDPIENKDNRTSKHHLWHDVTAFETFVKEHYGHLVIYCRFKFGFEMETAEDVVNSSFIKLWEVRQTMANDVSPKSYLYRIVHNLSLNSLKHERVRQQHARELYKTTSETIEQGTFDSVDLKQLRADIRAAVAELPSQMRTIFELSKFEELKYDEIATHLNISKKTVKTQMSRALTKLRDKLSHYYLPCLILMTFRFL